MMNRNTGISHYGRRDWTNVNVGQLSSQTNGLPQPARNAPAHPRRFQGVFPEPRPFFAPSRTPTSIGISASRPEPALNFKCFLLTSGRGVISP